MSSPPVVLTIGGSDSGGCYGVQADLRALAACGVHGACAITVVTAQNTTEFRMALPMPIALVAEQIEAVLADLHVAAVKTGMLGRPEVVELIGQLAASGRLPRLVVDPVLVDRHGTSLFGHEVCDAYRELLIPHAALVTPNSHEATLLVGSDPAVPVDPRLLGVPSVITAGRTIGEAVDLFWDGEQLLELRTPRLQTANTAGSGDSFSAVVAASLARGSSLREAVEVAKAKTHASLASASDWTLGAGPGPLDHLGWGH